MKVSEPAEGLLRDINFQGMATETKQIVVKGLAISYNEHPSQRNRVYLHMEIPTVGMMRIVGETVWYGRAAPGDSCFVKGLRFINICKEDRTSLARFLSGANAQKRIWP